MSVSTGAQEVGQQSPTDFCNHKTPTLFETANMTSP